MPKFTREPVNQNIEVDKGYVFECGGEGIPSPNVRWFVNGDDPAKYMDGVRKKLGANNVCFIFLHHFAWFIIYLYV